MSKCVRRLLGEAADVPAPGAVERDLAGAGEAEAAAATAVGGDAVADATTLTPGESIPVDTLQAMWEKGDKSAVAVRVLDALDSYQQFVELCFRIGHTGGLELGGLMDELTSEEKSPHEFDVVPDTELATKFTAGKGPRPGPGTHAATGESLTVRRLLGER
jgi:hypothetical protein